MVDPQVLLVPLLGLLERHPHDPRAVDEEVDLVHHGLDPLGAPPHGLGGGEVEPLHVDLDLAAGDELVGDVVALEDIPAEEDDAGAALGEVFGRLSPDAACAA